MDKGLANAARYSLAALFFGALSPLVYADEAQPSPPPAATAADGPADGCNPGSENEGFWQRLADSYKAHLFPSDPPPVATADAAAAPSGYDPDRVPAPPESIPPWPYSTWPMGGTEVIGYENIYYGPLMDALWCGKRCTTWTFTSPRSPTG